MAIPLALAEFICGEHRFRPLPPRILLLGRQTLTFGVDDLLRLASKFDLSVNKSSIEIDSITTYAKQRPDAKFVTDTSFFNMLGVKIIDSIDQSDYEGSNIILDLNKEVPSELCGQFDFIFNGSVLDNVWDPPELMRNISRLLDVNGRVIHVETATPCAYSYSALSPSWYFDYYVMNRWQDSKIYLAAVPTWDDLLGSRWATMAFDPSAEAQPNAFTPSLGDHTGISIVLGEKGPNSTISTEFAQSHYRDELQWQEFMERVEPLRKSVRPVYLGEGGDGSPIASHRNAWLSCGWLG